MDRFYWLSVFFFILWYSLALFIAHKNNHKSIKYILSFIAIVSIFFELEYGNIPAIVYLLFSGLKWAYNKIKIKGVKQ